MFNRLSLTERIACIGLCLVLTAGLCAAKAALPAKATASVLSYGSTLRIGVETSGIYRITYEDLQREGLLSAPVPSDRIALYGNRAGMLPTRNTADIYDDLTDLPIAMYDGGDGQFDNGDYFLFYGQSPVTWQYNATAQPAFTHRQHNYSDRTYYFIGHNHPTPAARITDAPRVELAGDEQDLTDFPDYLCYEKDLYNIVSGGQAWYGEAFNASGETRTIPLALNDLSTDPLSTLSQTGNDNVQLRVAASGLMVDGLGHLEVQAGAASGEISLPANTNTSSQVSGLYTAAFRQTATDLPVKLTYRKSGNAQQAYLDYIEIVYQRHLRLYRGQLLFRHPMANRRAANFRIDNAPANTQVWDVTDPYAVKRLQPQSAGTSSIRLRAGGADTLQTFLAFDGSAFHSPAFEGITAQQNLHGLPQTDYVVVTHPDFLAQAEEIARLHRERDGYRTTVATTTQVYNEFATGSPDPSAIRLFVKMFYDRADSNHAADRPKYLLLLGDASYDVKNRLGTKTNKIPTFEVPKAYSDESPATDDGFAFMKADAGLDSPADGDYFSYNGVIDIAVGRLPVKTVEEAETVTRKIDEYSYPYYERLTDWPQKQGNLGDWRQEITFVTDDDFESIYEKTLDFTGNVAAIDPSFNIEKIYADSYIKKAGAVTAAYPDAQAALRRRMNRGAFFVGYIGHSGWDAWGDEKYLTLNDIYNWEPMLSYPMMFASSCTFAYYDQEKTSAAEEAVLHPDGGAISVVASTRSASVGTIEYVQHDFLLSAIDRRGGQRPTIGDAFLNCKVKNRERSGTAIFILLGDPGLKTPLPRYDIKTLTLNGKPVDEAIDTLKALSHITIEGQIEHNGQRLDHFNGLVQIKVFDKPNHLKTLGNAQSRGGLNDVVEYDLQNSQIYHGSAEVKDGRFSFSFTVPKDIAYAYGPGKITYYAYSDTNGDAGGAFTGLTVGGFDNTADIAVGTSGPTVKLYLNKDNFLAEATGGDSPMLYAEISDEYGLNTTGAGIGHDMVLVIDGNYNNTVTVNNFFEYNTGSSTEGTLTYPLELSAGAHKVELKVWNIFNVSGTGVLEFGLSESNRFKVTALRVTPNPSRQESEVSFYFTHNGVGDIDRYELQVYDLYGRSVAKFEGKESSAYGYSVGPLTLSPSRNDLRKGVYIVRVVAYNRAGDKSTRHTKWVLQ